MARAAVASVKPQLAAFLGTAALGHPPTHQPTPQWAAAQATHEPWPSQGCSSELFRWRFVSIGRRGLNSESWRCSGPGACMAGLEWPWRWRRMPVSVWLLVLSNPYFDVQWYVLIIFREAPSPCWMHFPLSIYGDTILNGCLDNRYWKWDICLQWSLLISSFMDLCKPNCQWMQTSARSRR